MAVAREGITVSAMQLLVGKFAFVTETTMRLACSIVQQRMGETSRPSCIQVDLTCFQKAESHRQPTGFGPRPAEPRQP